MDRRPVVHDGLRAATAKGLTMATSNRSGGGGGPHRGLLWPARWREETGSEEE
jgi:hypothetical protein